MRSIICAALMVGVFIAAMSIAAGNTHRMDNPRGDVLYYQEYTRLIHEQGLGVYPELFTIYNQDPAFWQFPNPFRIGYIALVSASAHVFGNTVRNLEMLSLLSLGALLLSNGLFLLRFCRPETALFAGALLACSPTLLSTGTLPLPDMFSALALSLAIWTCYAAVHKRSAWWLFSMCAALSILAKESNVLLLAPFGAYILLSKAGWRKLLYVAAPAAGVGALYLVAAGGLSPILETARIILNSPATNKYAIEFGSGPWQRYLVDFIAVSPLPTLGAILYIGYSFGGKTATQSGEHETAHALGRYMAFVAALLLLEYALFTKNLRYVAVLDIPIRVLCALFLVRVAEKSTLCKGLVYAATPLLCAKGVHTYLTLFIKGDVYDPLTFFLLRGLHMIPSHLNY